MDKYTYKLNEVKTLNIANIIGVMKGGPALKILRLKIVKEILAVWPHFDPEFEREENFKEPSPKEEREITIKSKCLRAFAVGLVDLINDEKTAGRSVQDCVDFAGCFRVSNWVKKQIKTDKVEDFNEALDGEDPLTDEPEDNLTEE